MVLPRMARVPLVFLATLTVGALLVTQPWKAVFSYEVRSDSSQITSHPISGDSGRERHNDGDEYYIRDKTGYIYPKGYYEYERPGVPPSVKDMNVFGRHSDEVIPVCKNFSNGAGMNISSNYDYRVTLPNFSKKHKNPCWYDSNKTGQQVLKCIPYFYFIGSPKAGSTDLYFRITKHPDVTQCGAKERRFFDRQRFLKDSWSRFPYYLGSYKQASVNVAKMDTEDGKYNKIIFGDGSPTYIYNNINWYKMPGNEGCLEPRITCVSHIHHLNPDAKLILIARNPIDRLYSSYLYNWVRTGALRTPEEFHEWASKSVNAYKDCFQKHPYRACLNSAEIVGHTVLSVSASIYSRHLMDVLKVFPRDQLHVVKMEDYSANTAVYMKKVFDFLGLEPLSESQLDEVANVKEQNQGHSYKYAGPMLNSTRKMLYDFYRPYNQELAYILEDDTFLWAEEL